MKVIQTRRGTTTTKDNERMKDRKIKALRDHGPQRMKVSKILNESRQWDGEETEVEEILIVTFWGCRDAGDAVNEIYCVPTHFHPLSPVC